MLVKCESCNNNINADAEKCPFCGAPNVAGKKKRRTVALSVFLAALIIGFCVFEVVSSLFTSRGNDPYIDPSSNVENSSSSSIHSGGELDEFWDTGWQSE
ncbi:MAG: hypothetical protein IKI46_03015 [Lachnospiraceae bacterium]|nr:hypothetical protein [Lachnospiraceae bacterium]